ncbi:unnamed protein product [Sympodiomycopsis kandeliae]
MAEPARTSRTIYVGGLSPNVDEEVLVSQFSCFGDILDVQMPREGGARRNDERHQQSDQQQITLGQQSRGAHRGFGFLVFSNDQEAQDAIDNMHLNQLAGRILNVNIAKPLKAGTTPSGFNNRPVWEDEEWIKKYAKPLGQDGDESEEREAQSQSQEGNAE